jgi:methanogenic corrinoid protein MtbC1
MRPGREAGDPPVSDACRRYIEAAVNGSRREALAIVRAELESGSTLLDVYIDIFQTALYEIGRRWAANGLTVAEEHMATATTQFILSVLYEEMPRPSEHRGSAVITGIDNELHQVGANIVADALDADGWDVHFIGTNMPNDGILSAIEVHEPALVGISATRMANVGRVRDLIADIRGRKEAAPRIIVGGGAFRANPELWREVGADGFAPDARSALVLART